MPKLITLKDAAQRNGISARWLQKLCQDDEVPGAIKAGPMWLVPAAFRRKPQKRGPKPKAK